MDGLYKTKRNVGRKYSPREKSYKNRDCVRGIEKESSPAVDIRKNEPTRKNHRFTGCNTNFSADGSNSLVDHHLQKLYRSKILCDLSIKLGDRVYSIHKVALTSHSEKYFNILGDAATPVSEVYLEGVSPEIVEQVLEYLYTSDIEIREDCIDDIISICEQLDLKALKEKCFNFLGNFNENNVFHFLQLSKRHGLKKLARKMLNFVAENIDSICLDSHFKNLDVEDVCAILGSDTAHHRIRSEKHLLRIGVLWLKSGEPSEARGPFSTKVFERIALDKVDPKEICKQVNVVPFILDNSECLTVLRKAFRHHAILVHGDGKHSFGNDYCKNSSIPTPLLRDGGQSIVVIGGFEDTGESLEAGERVLKFSLSSSKWTTLPSLLIQRSGHGAAYVNSTLYVIGGYLHLTSSPIPTPTEMVVCYNDALSHWQGVSSMNVKRAMFALAATEDGHIYVFGGETEGFRPTESCECYSVETDQWTTIAPLSIGRIGVSACQHNGLIYVAGGIIEETVLPYVESYEFLLKRFGHQAANRSRLELVPGWSSRCPLPHGRCYGSLVQIADSLLYIGGIGVDRSTSTFVSMSAIFEYNLVQDNWVERSRLPNPRHFLSTVVVGDKVYVIGGFSTEVWEYCSDVVCFDNKSFRMDLSSVAPFPVGLMKAAAVGINQ